MFHCRSGEWALSPLGAESPTGPKFCHALTAPEPESECITEPGPGEPRRRASLCLADPQFQMRAAITLEQPDHLATPTPPSSRQNLAPILATQVSSYHCGEFPRTSVPRHSIHSGQASSPVRSRTNFFSPPWARAPSPGLGSGGTKFSAQEPEANRLPPTTDPAAPGPRTLCSVPAVPWLGWAALRPRLGRPRPPPPGADVARPPAAAFRSLPALTAPPRPVPAPRDVAPPPSPAWLASVTSLCVRPLSLGEISARPPRRRTSSPYLDSSL